MRLKLNLAYDGACFRGWQSQPGGGAVQDVLEAAMGRIAGGQKIRVHGAGRTDAGVHADGQVAHVDAPALRGGAGAWMRALNATLPPSLRVLRCTAQAESFHARYGASGKTYEYLLWSGEVLPPHLAGRCWHVTPRPRVSALRAAARVLRGKHDFRAFSANRGTPVHDATRHLRRITVSEDGGLIRLRFEGDGFLYKMVRMLAAAMVRVAQGRASLPALEARLAGQPSDFPREVAPPDGLYLRKVSYRPG